MTKWKKRVVIRSYSKPNWKSVIPRGVVQLIVGLDQIYAALGNHLQTELPEEIIEFLVQNNCPSVFPYYADDSAEGFTYFLLSLITGRTINKDSGSDKAFEEVEKILKNLNNIQIPPPALEKVKERLPEFILRTRALTYQVTCVQNNLESIKTITKAAMEGDDKSFFKLVQIDKAVINEPWARKRIYRAQMRREKRFFYSLSNALENEPLAKSRKNFRTSAAIAILDEKGLLSKLSYKQICDFLAEIGIAIKGDSAFKMFMKNYKKANLVKSQIF